MANKCRRTEKVPPLRQLGFNGSVCRTCCQGVPGGAAQAETAVADGVAASAFSQSPNERTTRERTLASG